MTHTYAIMEVSPLVYNEIRSRLLEVGYEHAIAQSGELDMHGIAIQEAAIPPTPMAQAIEALIENAVRREREACAALCSANADARAIMKRGR